MSEDRGAPIAYMALEEGTDVYASDGEKVGTVEHVLADVDADIFDGIVVDTRLGPGGWRFADATEVGEIYERAVYLKMTSAAVERLPEPEQNPAVMEGRPEDAEPDTAADKLRRAWDVISGRY